MKFTLLIISYLLFNTVYSQNERSIICYNVENLYDTIDDVTKNDSEFLPSAKNNWNSAKYFEKLGWNLQFFANKYG